MIEFVNHTFFLSCTRGDTNDCKTYIYIYIFFPFFFSFLKIDRTAVEDSSTETESVISLDTITCHTFRIVRRNVGKKYVGSIYVTRARYIEKCRGDAPSGQSFCELLTTRSCIRCTRCIHTHMRSSRHILHQRERGNLHDGANTWPQFDLWD